MKNGKALKQKAPAKAGGWIPVTKKMRFKCNVCLNVQHVTFRVRNKEDMQKIVDANEKLVKELKNGTNTISK